MEDIIKKESSIGHFFDKFIKKCTNAEYEKCTKGTVEVRSVCYN